MTATPPEANTEYSRGGRGFSGPGGGRRASLLAVAALGLLGAALLVAAEFLPLYALHLVSSERPVGTVSTGSHNAYALLPLAVLAALLSLAAARWGARAAPAALAALGVIALLIALLGDLPDTSAHGLTSHFVLAANTPRAGLYLETLGAVLLVLAGGGGLLLATGAPGTRVGPALRARFSGPAPGARSGS